MDLSTIPMTPAALADPEPGTIRTLFWVEDNLCDALDLPYTEGMTFRQLRILAADKLNCQVINVFFVNLKTGEGFDLDDEATPCSSSVTCCIAVGTRATEVLSDVPGVVEFLLTYALLSVPLTSLRWRGLHTLLHDGKAVAAPRLVRDIYAAEGISGFVKGTAFSLLTVGCCTTLGGVGSALFGYAPPALSVSRAINNAVLTALTRHAASSGRVGLASALFYVPPWTELRPCLAAVPASALWTILSELASSFIGTQYETHCLPHVFQFGFRRGWNLKHPIAEIILDLVPKVLLLHPLSQAERCIAINLTHTGPLHTLKWLYASGNLYTFIWQEFAMQVWAQIVLPRVMDHIARLRDRRAASLSLRRGMSDQSVRLRVVVESLGCVAALNGLILSGLIWLSNRIRRGAAGTGKHTARGVGRHLDLGPVPRIALPVNTNNIFIKLH